MTKDKVWKNHKMVADRQPPTVIRKESKKKCHYFCAIPGRCSYYKYKYMSIRYIDMGV